MAEGFVGSCQGVGHGWVDADNDGVFQNMGEVVFFGALFGDAVPLDGDVFQMFPGAQGLVEFG